ncbi:MAG: tenascin-X [Archangiaceae bacterium]|nr:tenascin-X [Archangiaceae bacterium]
MTESCQVLTRSPRRSAPGWLLLAALNVLVAGACKDDKLEPTTTVLRFGADPLKFDPVFADSQPRRKTVSVINDGRSTAEVSWQVPDEPIFLIDPPSVLPPGETELTVEFIPKVPGRLSRTLSVKTGDSRPVVLAIDAAARAIPQCVPTSTCATSSFDTTLQRCVETTVADGTSCDPQSACITGATCVGGRCIGAPKTCDDGNQCTIDVCNATLGCEFLPAPPCPGDGKCMQGVCDPVKGCGLAPMADGTTCGTLQTCLAAEICIEGACVVRDPPEGYVCAQASPCQDRGVCVNDVCVRPPATALLPSWSFDAAAVDAGTTTPQLHDFVMEPNGDMTLGGFFQTPVILRANTSSAKPTPLGVSRRCILWGPRLVCADYPASPNGRVTAIDPATGGTLWSYDVRTDRADFLMVAPQIFLARLVVQTTDRMAAVFEAYPVTTSSNPNTQCRRYFMVTLDAQGRAIAGQRIEDPLLDVCNHPHPYGVAADAVGNIFIAFSPTTSQQAPLKPGTPTLLMSYTRDGVFRWKVTDASMPGGELAVARGLLYPENGSVALLAATGAPAFSLPSALGRIVISDARFSPAPVQGSQTLSGYEAGLNTLRWTHVLPSASRFWSDQIRLASWKVPNGQRSVALTFIEDSANPLTPISLRAIHVNDGSEAFSCPLLIAPRTPTQLFEVGLNTFGMMEGALDENGGPGCGKCDPPFAGSSAAFRQFSVPGLSVPFEPWLGTFGGPSHDHREEVQPTGPGPN